MQRRINGEKQTNPETPKIGLGRSARLLVQRLKNPEPIVLPVSGRTSGTDAEHYCIIYDGV